MLGAGSRGAQDAPNPRLAAHTADKDWTVGTSNQGSLATAFSLLELLLLMELEPESQEAYTRNACPRDKPHSVKPLTVAPPLQRTKALAYQTLTVFGPLSLQDVVRIHIC